MHLIADLQKKQRLDLVAVKCIYFILGKKREVYLNTERFGLQENNI